MAKNKQPTQSAVELTNLVPGGPAILVDGKLIPQDLGNADYLALLEAQKTESPE